MRISDWSSDVCSSDREVHSWNRFERPAVTRYPAKPAAEYPFFAIRNDDNPFAVWDPTAWSWGQIADFRGYAVWAKSPLAGVYVSRRQGEATAVELGLLPALAPGAELVEVMPWGGTYSAERSEEHTSELQSLMRNSYDVLCLKKKN